MSSDNNINLVEQQREAIKRIVRQSLRRKETYSANLSLAIRIIFLFTLALNSEWKKRF